jgi:hypothetical protein
MQVKHNLLEFSPSKQVIQQDCTNTMGPAESLVAIMHFTKGRFAKGATMQQESHEQYAFETYKGIEIADALTANGENKIWVGLGDASGHASGVWLTAEEAAELSDILSRIAQAHMNRSDSAHPASYKATSGNSPSEDPTAFPG